MALVITATIGLAIWIVLWSLNVSGLDASLIGVVMVALVIAYIWIAILLVATWFVGNLPYGVLAVPPGEGRRLGHCRLVARATMV